MPSLEIEQRQLLQVLEGLDALAGMRHQHLRVLLEHGGDHQRRDVLRHRVERLQRVRAHVEVDAAGRQQQPVVHVRPARHDGDVEPVPAVGAVDQRLVEAAVLGLRHPVGGEADLVERLGLRSRAADHDRGKRGRAHQCQPTSGHSCLASAAQQ